MNVKKFARGVPANKKQIFKLFCALIELSKETHIHLVQYFKEMTIEHNEIQFSDRIQMENRRTFSICTNCTD